MLRALTLSQGSRNRNQSNAHIRSGDHLPRPERSTPTLARLRRQLTSAVWLPWRPEEEPDGGLTQEPDDTGRGKPSCCRVHPARASVSLSGLLYRRHGILYMRAVVVQLGPLHPKAASTGAARRSLGQAIADRRRWLLRRMVRRSTRSSIGILRSVGRLLLRRGRRSYGRNERMLA